MTDRALSHRFTEESQAINSHTPTAVHSPFVARGPAIDLLSVCHGRLCTSVPMHYISTCCSCITRTHCRPSTRVYHPIEWRVSNCHRSTDFTVDVCASVHRPRRGATRRPRRTSSVRRSRTARCDRLLTMQCWLCTGIASPSTHDTKPLIHRFVHLRCTSFDMCVLSLIHI